MSDPAIAKVEDALKAQLQAWPGLAGYTIQADPNEAEAVECETDKLIRIYTVAYAVDQSDEQWQTIHTATIEFEAINASQATGTISRANQTALAHVLGAIASDRTVGGRLLDIQEVDVASSGANMRDADAASLQTTVTFFTPRDDWFTIVGAGGATF